METTLEKQSTEKLLFIKSMLEYRMEDGTDTQSEIILYGLVKEELGKRYIDGFDGDIASRLRWKLNVTVS